MKKIYLLLFYFLIHFPAISFAQFQVNTTVKDINIYPGSDPKGMALAGNQLMLSLANPDYGVEPHKYNIDTKSFELVKNIYPNFWESMLNNEFYEMDGKFYYFAQESSNLQLWSTDLVNNVTIKVKDFGESYSSSNDLTAKAVNSKLFIKHYNKLYVSDGSNAGTFQLATVSSSKGSIAVLGNELYFYGYNNQTGTELWKSDGTISGTKIVKDVNVGFGSISLYGEQGIYSVNGKILFYAHNTGQASGIYVTDGTASGTSLLKSGSYQQLNAVYKSQSKMVFSANSDLWVSDATTAGTRLVKSAFGNFKNYFIYKNKIYINSDSGIYVIDEDDNVDKFETPGNTALEIISSSNGENYLILKEAGITDAKIYLYNGLDLTKSNINFSGDTNFVETPDRLIFSGYTESYVDGYNVGRNTELFYYNYDGTFGTEKEFFTRGSSFPRFFTKHKDMVFFVARSGVSDQIFYLDKNNNVKQAGNLVNIKFPTDWGNYHPRLTIGEYIYFYHSNILTRSNATEMITDQITVPANESVLEVYPLSETGILIKTYNQLHGFMRLYKLNSNSTALVKLLEMPSNYYSTSSYEDFAKAGNEIYFKMLNISQSELWKTDGTSGNTVKIRDLASPYFMKNLVKKVNNKIYFVEDGSVAGQQDKLYYIDYTTGETKAVSEYGSYALENSFVINDELYFFLSNYESTTKYHLVKTSGTAVTNVAELPTVPSQTLKCGNYFYMKSAGASNSYGVLYRTDGSSDGTLSIAPQLLYTDKYTCVQNELYFMQDSEMYFTNGQPGDYQKITFKIDDVATTPNFYIIESVDDRFLISKDIPGKGYELVISEIMASPLSTARADAGRHRNNLVIYPNPTVSEARIIAGNGETIKNVQITDPAGRLVFSGQNEVINIQHLPAGVYFIKVQTNDSVYSGKIIKKN